MVILGSKDKHYSVIVQIFLRKKNKNMLITFKHLLFSFLCRRTLIDQIDNTHIRYASIGLQTDFTGSAVRLAHLNMVRLDLGMQFTQAILIQFREGESSVARESATPYPFREEHIV